MAANYLLGHSCAIMFSVSVWMMLGDHREFIYFQF